MDKPGTPVNTEDEISVKGDPIGYVSRGGLKLKKALNYFLWIYADLPRWTRALPPAALPTCMLKNGVKKVFAVDVGYGQLAWNLRQDERVVCMERTNIRYVTEEQLGGKVDFAVCDLSFISLKLVLPVIRKIVRDDANVVCLIKPQFEAGREQVGKKGVVRDPAVHKQVLWNFCEYSGMSGYTVMGITFSPITGPEGNIEYLGLLRAGLHSEILPDIAHLVQSAFSELHIKNTGEGNEKGSALFTPILNGIRTSAQPRKRRIILHNAGIRVCVSGNHPSYDGPSGVY